MLLRISTERMTLADSINRLKPPKEKRRKTNKQSRRDGKKTQTGRKREFFRTPAMLKTTPLACDRKAT